MLEQLSKRVSTRYLRQDQIFVGKSSQATVRTVSAKAACPPPPVRSPVSNSSPSVGNLGGVLKGFPNLSLSLFFLVLFSVFRLPLPLSCLGSDLPVVGRVGFGSRLEQQLHAEVPAVRTRVVQGAVPCNHINPSEQSARRCSLQSYQPIRTECKALFPAITTANQSQHGDAVKINETGGYNQHSNTAKRGQFFSNRIGSIFPRHNQLWWKVSNRTV